MHDEGRGEEFDDVRCDAVVTVDAGHRLAVVSSGLASSVLVGGMSCGIGSLPHRDAREAAIDALAHTPGLATIPSLPRRSPAEAMIAQAVVGIGGISLGQYGSLLIDVATIDPMAPVVTDLDNDAFVGLRAFLDAAEGRTAPVKWQFTGPVTLGRALMRAGVPMHDAFDVAVRTVRHHVRSIADEVRRRLPDAPQVVFIDEPDLDDLEDESFPIAPDTAIDLMSGALAVLESDVVVGLHSCSSVALKSLVSAGPEVLSVPVAMVEPTPTNAAVLAGFMESGGFVAWGAVPTDGPMMAGADRWWKKLAELWCELVQHGCDAKLLRERALVTPACGVAVHDVAAAGAIFDQVRDIAERVRTQALATRFTLGA